MKKIEKEITVTKHTYLYDREDVSSAKDSCKRMINDIRKYLDSVDKAIDKCEHSGELDNSLELVLLIKGYDDENLGCHYDGICEDLFDGIEKIGRYLHNIEQQEKYGDRYLEEIAYYM